MALSEKGGFYGELFAQHVFALRLAASTVDRVSVCTKLWLEATEEKQKWFIAVDTLV